MVALLIDYDTVAGACRALPTRGPRALSAIISAAKSFGPITVAKVYSKGPRLKARVHNLVNDVTIAKQPGVVLATDAVALLARQPAPDIVVIVSGDREVLPVVRTLVAAGRYVVVVATRNRANTDLLNAIDYFLPLDDVIARRSARELAEGNLSLARKPLPVFTRQARLRVFLCHSSGDKAVVRALYRRLRTDGFEPWLDEEKLLPGHEWEAEISTAVRTAGAVIVCLSRDSVTKEGFVQKEIKYVWM